MLNDMNQIWADSLPPGYMESESQVTLMLLQLMNRVNAEIRFQLYLIDEKRQSILYLF